MMRLPLALACSLAIVLIVGCAVSATPQALPVDSADGLALLQKATDIQRAVRATSDARTATLQAATISAAETRDTTDRIATGTAQALQVRQTEVAANATANALGLQQSQTRQAATETSDARHVEATRTTQAFNIAAAQTSQVQVLNFQGSRTADAVHATGTAAAATLTRGAEEIQAALDHSNATSTAVASAIQQSQAQADAVRSTRWADFLQSALQALIALGGLALLLIGIIAAMRYLGDRSMRQRLIETRAGTVLLTPLEGGGYTAQLVSPAAQLLEPGDEFDGSQVKAVRNEAEDLLKVTTARGESFIARTDPEDEAREARRKLAMRLLRESISHYQRKGIDPRTVNRIPPAPELGWSPDTWVRAVSALKPHVITRQGRGGGTFCAGEFPHLVALYTAVGERRVLLEERAPSPAVTAAVA